MQEHTFVDRNGQTTIFRHEDGHLWLSELFGQACGFSGTWAGPQRVRGLAVVDTSLGLFEGDGLEASAVHAANDRLTVAWTMAGGRLQLESAWQHDAVTGVWRRADTLINTGPEPVTVYQCQARFTFTPGAYEYYSQGCRWCAENQGVWQELCHGTHVLHGEGGRTVQVAAPFICLRNTGGGAGIAFHVLPRGNYEIALATPLGLGTYGLVFARVEMGLASRRLRLTLPPGGRIDLPVVYIMPAPHGDPVPAAPVLHAYVNRKEPAPRTRVPVVFNTWFFDFQTLDVVRLRQQLAAARDIGCEVFTVDAGWYGTGDGSWYRQAGDWREKEKAAFRGNMAAFADEVRAAGLGFGLWMEPERVNPDLQVVHAHPDWFVKCGNGFCYPDLTVDGALNWLHREMERLITAYGVTWMKIDFNFDLDTDPSGAELLHQADAWYGLIDRVRRDHPDLVLEGCASGGMRCDLEALRHFDVHFLSDTVNPTDAIRIGEGALLRVPPGRVAKWAVLRPFPPIGFTDGSLADVLAPGRGGWECPVTADVEFVLRTAMAGALGISGDIASLPAGILDRIGRAVAWYKAQRAFIVRSIAHLLTPPRPLADRTGWSALQLSDPASHRSLLFAYRLDDPAPSARFRLRGLDPERTYRVTDIDDTFDTRLSGMALMRDGIEVTLKERYRAAVVEVDA